MESRRSHCQGARQALALVVKIKKMMQLEKGAVQLLNELLGRGNHSVRLAFYQGRLTAVKLFNCNDPNGLREISLLQHIGQHSTIVDLVGIEQYDQQVYVVMELGEWGTLSSHIQHGKIPLENIRWSAVQLVCGLWHLRRRSVVWGDLKSSNIIIGEKGVKMIDFGNGRLIDEIFVCKTTDYACAPEIVLGISLLDEDALLADYWALGVCLFEMLTGKLPFYHQDPNHLKLSILHDNLELSGNGDLEDLIRRLLVKDWRRRMNLDDIVRHAYFGGCFEVICGVLKVKNPQFSDKVEWDRTLGSLIAESASVISSEELTEAEQKLFENF